MEPGTGKTRAAMELVKSVPDIDLVLWLCPFPTKQNLSDEADKHGGFDCSFQVHGIETLSSSDKTYMHLRSMIESAKKPFLVVDESLKIKNWDARRTKRIIELGLLVEYKLILNGTPLTRDLLDLWAQMEFLSPKILKMGLAEFRNTFCVIVRKTTSYGNRRKVEEWIKDYTNIDHLHSLIDPYVFRYDLRLSVAKNYKTVGYELSEEEREHYAKLKEWFLDPQRMAMLDNNIFLQMVQKMQHSYCCSPAKADAIAKVLESCEPDKTLIFCKFIDSRDLLANTLPDCRVLTYGKHSLGLNLQDYHTIIYADKTFDYAQRIQSEHRTYRTGQRFDCHYVDLTGNIGLEAMIDKNIARKTSLLQYFKEKGMEAVKEL